MSQTQDVFGAAPQRVLNKPMMQMQWQIATGGTPPTLGIGEFDVPMNSILVSEISGAGLSDPLISLPAGTYYIEAVAATRVGAAASAAARLYVTDDADTKLLIGKNGYSYGVNNNIELDVSGKITLASSGNIKLRRYSEDAGSEGWYTNQAPYEVLADLRIWKLDSDIETEVEIVDPNMTLTRPLFHAQDQKPNGTEGGDSIAGWNDRILNTLVTNEIVGASLSVNQVTLPAGTYQVFCHVPFGNSGRSTGSLRDVSDDSVLLRGTSALADNGAVIIAGRLELTAQTTIKVSMFVGTTAGNGLGHAALSGDVEVYTNFLIWQLDAVSKLNAIGNVLIESYQFIDATGQNTLDLDCTNFDTFEITNGTNNPVITLNDMDIGRTVTLTIVGATGATFADTIEWPDGIGPVFTGNHNTVVLTRMSGAIVGSYSLDQQ